MFFRIKPSGERRYLQIVENTRDGASTRQRVLATLGRVEDLEADGRLDALLRSGARFSDTAVLISSLQAGTLETGASLRIGAPMIFGRLWEQTGCHKVIERLAAGRGFGFPVERAVFASVVRIDLKMALALNGATQIWPNQKATIVRYVIVQPRRCNSCLPSTVVVIATVPAAISAPTNSPRKKTRMVRVSPQTAPR